VGTVRTAVQLGGKKNVAISAAQKLKRNSALSKYNVTL
jgi:hypothetical protein